MNKIPKTILINTFWAFQDKFNMLFQAFYEPLEGHLALARKIPGLIILKTNVGAIERIFSKSGQVSPDIIAIAYFPSLELMLDAVYSTVGSQAYAQAKSLRSFVNWEMNFFENKILPENYEHASVTRVHSNLTSQAFKTVCLYLQVYEGHSEFLQQAVNFISKDPNYLHVIVNTKGLQVPSDKLLHPLHLPKDVAIFFFEESDRYESLKAMAKNFCDSYANVNFNLWFFRVGDYH